MRILVADDEEVVRSTIEGILAKKGENVIDFARDGEEALARVNSLKYDLILLDLDMPKLNGYETLPKIREIYPDVPVVFITATGEAHQVMKSIARYKLNGFIEKPFTPEQVNDIVATVTRKAQPGA